MNRLFTFFLLSIISFSAFCQTEKEKYLLPEIDRLKARLSENIGDTTKVRLLIEIAENYRNQDLDSNLHYTEKALTLSEQIDYIQGQVGALGFRGDGMIGKGNLPKALELSLKAIELGDKLPIQIAGVGPSYDNIGRIYLYIGDYKKALRYFIQMVSLGEDDIVGKAFGYHNMATVYVETNQLDSAMLYLEKSYDTFKRVKYSVYPDIYHVYPHWYNLRAKVYLKQRKQQLALNDFKTSLNMTLSNEDHILTIDTYNDLARFYKNLNKKDSVIYHAELGMAEAQKISYTRGVWNASNILAEEFENIDAVKALFYHKISAQTQNSLYGAGNIQTIKDMIAQNEKRKQDLEIAEVTYRNRLRQNILVGGLGTLIIIAFLLYRNNKTKQRANLLLNSQKQEIQSTLAKLKSTQTQLIHSEKMASLGELTAGIAHEIQNPLNFVNNFSDVSGELLDEVSNEIDQGNTHDVKVIISDLKLNLEKITIHGKRADSIVKAMLQHSRTSSGKKEATDINNLCDEYLRLAFHGMRAKDKSFNASFETDFDPGIPKVRIVPQDMGRVLLNLINNAFHAVDDKAKTSGDLSYKPSVKITTRNISPSGGGAGGGSIQITISDNGPGIPDEIKEKIFQPFFTTKPTGEGTGLGLSLVYDMVKAHGGELSVESEEGRGAIFTMSLPIVGNIPNNYRDNWIK